MTEPNVHVPARATIDGDPPLADQRRRAEDDRDIGQIMGDLTNDVSTLMRQEVALARAEITQAAKKAGRGAGLFGGAGVAAHLALLFISLALWWLLAHVFDSDDPRFGWSVLVVAVVWGIVAAVMAAKGKSEFEDVEGVPRTTESIKQIPNAIKGDEEKNR